MSEINITEVMIGCQGSGKSWHAMHRAATIASEYDCPLIIHDAGSASISKSSNPYHHCDWKRYKQSCLDERGNRIGNPPRMLFPPDIIVVNTAYAEDALIYADYVRKGKDCVVLIDEVTATRTITPQNIGEPWRSRIAQRRAMRTALLLCMQSPTMASRFLVSTATAIKCFRLGKHKVNLAAVANVGYAPEHITLIPVLKRGHYITLNQGFGSDE